MGNPTPAKAYRDDPDGDAVSMHTTRDDYEYDDAPALPSYSDSEAAAAGSASSRNEQPSAEHHQPAEFAADPYRTIRYDGLHTSGGKVRNANEVGIRMETYLDDPEELQKYIENYVRIVPPSPLVRIVGTHQETRYDASRKKNEKERVVDFDIIFSLQHHLKRESGFWKTFVADNSDKEYRGSFRKTRAPGFKHDIEVGDQTTPTLQDWCREYCNSKSYLKVFRVERQLDGFQGESIKDMLTSFVRSTHYHGHLDISFPVEDKYIDIYNPHPVNRARIGWIRYIFYFTFLWLITWPILFFMTKWWTVYTVRWTWSYCKTIEEEQRAIRVYASISERAWAKTHENLIKALVLEKFQGDATPFPCNVPAERVESSMRGRMPSTGNANVDSAVNFIQGGVGLWNAVQGRGNGDPRAWGADSC